LRFAEDFVLLAKGETVLQSKIDRLIDIDMLRNGKNVDKTTIRTADCDRAKKTEESGIFQQFGLLGAIFTRETEPRLSVAKAGFNKKKALLPGILTKFYGIN